MNTFLNLTIVAILLSPLPSLAQAVIKTVAGNGSTTYSGAKVAATDAELNGPSGVFVDAAGILYIADQSNFAIRKVDKTGTMTTIGGCGPDISCLEAGPFLGGSAVKTSVNPYDIVVDKAGNVYITDGSRNAVEKVDTGGTITAFAGTGKPTADLGDGGPANKANLSTPVGLDIDKCRQYLHRRFVE